MRGTLGVGFIGTGWISRAHAHALHTLNHVAPLPAEIRLVSIAGRSEERAAAAATELGFARSTTSWEAVVGDPEVAVVATLAAVEGHAEPTLAALAAGKPVLCEKPLGADVEEARAMCEAARDARVTNACGYNYRYVPAVALAREVAEAGRIGELRHYRAEYLQDFQVTGQQTRSSHGGAGAVLDYAHLVDMLRFFVGEPAAVTAHTAQFVSETEDAYLAVLELPGGATGALEASRCAVGWKGRHRIELNGSAGSLWWDMEDFSRLHVFLLEDERERLGGFRDVLVTQPDHPFLREWWPPGHVIGWAETFVHQWRDFLEAVLDERPVPARQASFEDGYRAAVLCDAILTSAREGRRIEIPEPDLTLEPVGQISNTKGRE
jgi:predicted dehydrogenase